MIFTVSAQETCLEIAPPTVYEAEEMSPQNMDFDRENNMIIAHSGWYNDFLVHYYKFRMYTPSTYPGLIVPGGSSADVPLQKVYMVSSTGDFDGIIGKPVLEYHTSDGNLYSDFMEVIFVTAPTDYVEDTFKMVSDITESGADMQASGIILNLPIVPTGATLQDPEKKGTAKAPIAPVLAWYKCVEVWTYVFEVTDQSAADYFQATRTGADPNDPAYKIYVKPSYATSNNVAAIPLIHVNQFSHGVIEGKNGGGPSPAGMKNVINLDRPDDGYSPLWLIRWMTELPINYNADEASSFPVMLDEDNGFNTFFTPMYVNCPDIGSVNLDKNNINGMLKEDFQTNIDLSLESNWIMGSHQDHILKADIPISFQLSDGTEISRVTTSMMGSYEYELKSSDIPEGTEEISLISSNEVIRVIKVAQSESSGAFRSSTVVYSVFATLTIVCYSIMF